MKEIRIGLANGNCPNIWREQGLIARDTFRNTKNERTVKQSPAMWYQFSAETEASSFTKIRLESQP